MTSSWQCYFYLILHHQDDVTWSSWRPKSPAIAPFLTDLCERNPPVTCKFPSQRASYTDFPWYDVGMMNRMLIWTSLPGERWATSCFMAAMTQRTPPPPNTSTTVVRSLNKNDNRPHMSDTFHGSLKAKTPKSFRPSDAICRNRTRSMLVG